MDCSSPGSQLAFLVDFGPETPTRLTARVLYRSHGASALVGIRLDQPNGLSIGSFSVGDVGGRDQWQTVPATVRPAPGRHTVYLTIAPGAGTEQLELDWITFG
ncbi:carbohydrate-binding protein [Streptomyces sp. NPDC058476]